MDKVNIYAEFVNMSSEQCRTLGPFSYIQVRYGEIVVGSDGDSVLAVESESGCWTVNGVEYTDFIVTASSNGPDPSRQCLSGRKPPRPQHSDSLTEGGDLKKQTVAIACVNASGEADLFLAEVEATDDQVLLGEHYDIATAKAQEEGYEQPFVCFDECEQGNLHRAYANLLKQVEPWEDNDHRFLRLLAAMHSVADLSQEQLAAIAASMALEPANVRELLARASDDWDAI